MSKECDSFRKGNVNDLKKKMFTHNKRNEICSEIPFFSYEVGKDWKVC